MSKIQKQTLVAGPGVHVYHNISNYTTWINNEQVEIEDNSTTVSIDPVFLQESVRTEVNAMFDRQLADRLIKIVQNHIKLDYIVWDDKGTLTTQIIVDGIVALEKSIELPLTDVIK